MVRGKAQNHLQVNFDVSVTVAVDQVKDLLKGWDLGPRVHFSQLAACSSGAE